MNTERLEELKAFAVKEAKYSQCEKRKVGAIITTRDGYILSQGHNYNTAEGPCENNGITEATVIHAEVSAINKLPTECEPWYIFTTHQPCENCTKAINQEGLTVILCENFLKFDSGKLQYNLIPPEMTKALASVLTYGAKKYKPNNWKSVDDQSRYIDALYRHLEAWRSGETNDSESGLSHLAHALTNVGFLLYLELHQDDKNVSEND
jgi:tRNA(Arg) A34 adenosine deaminase TadA